MDRESGVMRWIAAIAALFILTSPATIRPCRTGVCVEFRNAIAETDEGDDLAYWEIQVDTEPVTYLIIGNPNYTSQGPSPMTYVSSHTFLDFQAVDQSGTGIASTFYRVDSAYGVGEWINHTQTGTVDLGYEGELQITWYSIDNSGGREPDNTTALYLDDMNPYTAISPSSSTAEEGTHFTLIATDVGSGIQRTEYKIGDGVWMGYFGPFHIPPGEQILHFRSIDNIGNIEWENVQQITITHDENYKPYMAAAFAAVLAAYGLIAAGRKPWKGKRGLKGNLYAFAITSLPFVALESATGIYSLAAHELAIPPWKGFGIGLDLLILVIGLVIPLWRAFIKIGHYSDSVEDAIEPPKA